MELTADEIRRILGWAKGSDLESYLDEHDLPLVERLCGEVGEEPAAWVPDALRWFGNRNQPLP